MKHVKCSVHGCDNYTSTPPFCDRCRWLMSGDIRPYKNKLGVERK